MAKRITAKRTSAPARPSVGGATYLVDSEGVVIPVPSSTPDGRVSYSALLKASNSARSN